jgi:hypothetical protein
MENLNEDEFEGKTTMSFEDYENPIDKDQINDPFGEVFSIKKVNYEEEDLEITKEDNENRYFINTNKKQYQTENNNTPNTKSTSPTTNINLVKKDQNLNLNTPLKGYDYSKVKDQVTNACEAVFSTNKVNDDEGDEITEKVNINGNFITKTSPITSTNSFKTKKIFDISKVNKKVGRMLKKLKKKLKAAHNKYSEDNIIRKFKARFQDILLNYINYEYSKFMETKGKSKIVKLLQRINPNESRKISKADNLRWFSTKLKDLFSSDLSQKCSLYDSNYNKCTIENLYKNNEALNVINILEKEVIDLYDLYRNNVKIDGFTTLEDDLKLLREKMEKENEEEEEEEDIELYLSNYRNIAMKLDEIFDKKKGRNKKKSKKNSL